jgi:hypothetical protein
MAMRFRQLACAGFASHERGAFPARKLGGRKVFRFFVREYGFRAATSFGAASARLER